MSQNFFLASVMFTSSTESLWTMQAGEGSTSLKTSSVCCCSLHGC
jgi:hypothetical protein